MPEEKDKKPVIDNRSFADLILSTIRPASDATSVKLPPPSSHGFVAIIGDEVFKAPNNPAYAVAVQREALLQDMLRAQMAELGHLVPEVTAREQVGGLPVFGMRKVTGEITTNDFLASLPAQERAGLARDIARFMLNIHTAITQEDAKMLKLEEGKTVTAQALADSLADPLVQKTLGPEMLEKARQVEKAFATYHNKPQEKVFTHGDLNPYNLLYDRAAGKLGGVIDFGLAGINTVEHEFYRLGLRPREFLQAVASEYEAGGGGKVDLDRVQTLHAATMLESLRELVQQPNRAGYMNRMLGELSTLLQDVSPAASAPQAAKPQTTRPSP